MSAGGGRPPAQSRPDFPGVSGAESSVLGVRFGERPPRAVCLLCAFTPRPRDPSQRPLTATVWAQRTSGCQRLRFLRPLCGPFVSSWALGFFKAFAPSSSLRCGFFSKATPEGRQPVGSVRLVWSHRSWFPAGHLPWACVHVLSPRPVPVVGGVLTPTGEVQSEDREWLRPTPRPFPGHPPAEWLDRAPCLSPRAVLFLGGLLFCRVRVGQEMRGAATQPQRDLPEDVSPVHTRGLRPGPARPQPGACPGP